MRFCKVNLYKPPLPLLFSSLPYHTRPFFLSFIATATVAPPSASSMTRIIYLISYYSQILRVYFLLLIALPSPNFLFFLYIIKRVEFE